MCVFDVKLDCGSGDTFRVVPRESCRATFRVVPRESCRAICQVSLHCLLDSMILLFFHELLQPN